ncbi:MAG: hypothetical protein H8E36_09560 [Rhodospirillaceae bacterium]|nr:hypothetical protein [Rhodospirillaceae bacterium]MBL6930154.1 hypothetical protein [Rhodospirillales bacterium]MBL6940822.1 hypothetical protein [Rhodospirillales bacterium]
MVTTEHIYFGGYAIVIGGSLITVLIARRAARVNDLEEAKKKLEANRHPEPDPAGENETLQDTQDLPEGNKEDE